MYNYGKLFASNPTLNFYEIFGTKVGGHLRGGKEELILAVDVIAQPRVHTNFILLLFLFLAHSAARIT